jgi:uncharacterized protein YchJ
MRLVALGAILTLSCFGTVSVQAACLKAGAGDQVAEGRLASVRISIPAYQLKEQAYVLQLAAPACLEGTGDFDQVDKTERIHVFATEVGLRKRLRGLVGKVVRVRGEPFGEHTAHHHAPIVMRIDGVEPVPRK